MSRETPPVPPVHDYLNEKKVPDLFQALTIALLYHQPEDHIDYLLDCVNKVRDLGWENIVWDTFLPEKRVASRVFHQRAPLPPVTGELNGGVDH